MFSLFISQEYQSSFQDVNRYRGTADRLESQIQTEIKIRTDLENRNAALDKEISKVGHQLSQRPMSAQFVSLSLLVFSSTRSCVFIHTTQRYIGFQYTVFIVYKYIYSPMKQSDFLFNSQDIASFVEFHCMYLYCS